MTGSSNLPGVYRRYDPVAASSPVVFEVPRSGSEYPARFRSAAPFDAVHRSISMYLEELYRGVPNTGATLLFACFPNTFIDANRHELDIDPDLLDGEWPEPLRPTVKSKLGIGLIHSTCGTGDVPLHSRKLSIADVKDRLDSYYWPYHNELSRLLARHRQAHGVTYHISCHSMASIGGKSTLDAGKPRSQVDIGDLNGTSCEPGFVDVVKRTMEGLGYEATVNRHYAGAESVCKHADPENGCHSLQIELNRSLYMNEDDFTKGPNFKKLSDDLSRLGSEVAAYVSTRSTKG